MRVDPVAPDERVLDEAARVLGRGGLVAFPTETFYGLGAAALDRRAVRRVFEVKGRGAYSRLKYESGVHRVQRVPATESQGRIHTSTATVAVLAEVEEVDVKIDAKDLPAVPMAV